MGTTEETVQQPETEQGKEQPAQPNEVDVLKSQLAEKEKQVEQWQKESKAHQAQVTKKAQELQRLQSQLQKPAQSNVSSELLKLYEEQDPTNPRIQSLKAQLAREEQWARQNQITSDAKGGLEQKIREKGLDPEDEQFDSVWDAFIMAEVKDGNFTRADKRLDRILGRQKSPEIKEQPKKSEEVNEEEVARKYLEKKGLLTSETGHPSASGKSFQQFESDFISGKVDRQTYEERARREGKI